MTTEFAELPALHVSEEDPREQVIDLEFRVQDEGSRTVKVGRELPAAEVTKYAALFTEFGHLFIGKKQTLPQTILNEHKIELKAGAKPKVHKLRRIKPEHMKAVREEIDKLLEQGCIIPVYNSE